MVSQPSARGKPITATSKVLGLLVALCLNMIILPCAMAIQGDDDCPHCPPAENHDMMTHQGRGEAGHHGHDENTHQGHGGNSVTPPCATVQPDCCDGLVATVDFRGGKEAYKPASQFVMIAAPAPFTEARAAAARYYAVSDPPDTPGVAPPRHVLFCVYLD